MANIFADSKLTKKFDGTREGRLGTTKNPVTVRVQTEERSAEIKATCATHGWECAVKVDPSEPEDTTQLDRLLNPPKPTVSEQKVGRNDPCPCGSGKKYKHCHGK
jgi:SWIM/SEC-C metal-binding protein